MSIISILLASLLGSVHCAAMCGAFAAIASDNQPRANLGVVAYNLGRLATYCALGALAGTLGHSLDAVGYLGGIGGLSSVFLGGVLVVYGAFRLLSGECDTKFSRFLHRSLGSAYRSCQKYLPSNRPLLRAFGIGLLSTLLPCGWLYGFAAIAATTGDPFAAIFVMAIFWVGTLPMMVSLGSIMRGFISRWSSQLPAISSALLIAAGLFSIASHFDSSGHHHSSSHIASPQLTK